MSNEPTMKLVTNLDRAAIEAKLREVAAGAQAAGLGELAKMFVGIEGMPAAQIEQRVNSANKWLIDKPQHMKLAATLDLVGMNLKNLK
ncbi:MAG TPA: hypothetical protein VLV90_03065 [Burkholderiales bacterium]|nr:hypothetical protein [Burkholderiales bacterium]